MTSEAYGISPHRAPTIALIQEQHGEMRASIDQLAEEIKEMTDDPGGAKRSAQAELQARRQLLRTVSKRSGELKATLKQSPRVIHSDSEWDW